MSSRRSWDWDWGREREAGTRPISQTVPGNHDGLLELRQLVGCPPSRAHSIPETGYWRFKVEKVATENNGQAQARRPRERQCASVFATCDGCDDQWTDAAAACGMAEAGRREILAVGKGVLELLVWSAENSSLGMACRSPKSRALSLCRSNGGLLFLNAHKFPAALACCVSRPR